MKYRIWCEMWSGDTGYSCEWVIDNATASGLAEFYTLGEAAEKAERMQRQIDTGPTRTTRVRCIAKPLT